MRYDRRDADSPERWIDAERLIVKRRITREKNAESPEKRRGEYRRWWEANKETARKASKAWRHKNPQKARDSSRRWQKENRGARLEGLKRWRDQHPEHGAVHRVQRRALMPSPECAKEREDIRLIYKVCALLNSIHRKWAPRGMFHVDHVLALSKGGEHKARNLRIATARLTT